MLALHVVIYVSPAETHDSAIAVSHFFSALLTIFLFLIVRDDYTPLTALGIFRVSKFTSSRSEKDGSESHFLSPSASREVLRLSYGVLAGVMKASSMSFSSTLLELLGVSNCYAENSSCFNY